MSSLPLHPALVHLPLGLSFVLPLAALALAFAVWRGERPLRGLVAVATLQLLLVGGAAVALKTGEKEEDRVERRVPEAALKAHESAAQQFLGVAAASLALPFVAVLLGGRGARAFSLAGVAVALAVTGLAVRVGHAGGQLVYSYGAASAYASGPSAAGGPEGTAGPGAAAAEPKSATAGGDPQGREGREHEGRTRHD